MRTCPKCDELCAEDANYCEACGAALVPPALIAREWRHHGKAIRDRQRRKAAARLFVRGYRRAGKAEA